MNEEINEQDNNQIVEIPIDGILDLHTFSPKDVPSVVDEYLRECRKLGIRDVRIIHGKGKGVLRCIVHSRLEKNPIVESFYLDGGPSGWGATIAVIKIN